MAKKITPRYKEAEGKQKVAWIYIPDNTFYLLLVLCSHLGSVRLRFPVIGIYNIVCTIKLPPLLNLLQCYLNSRCQ